LDLVKLGRLHRLFNDYVLNFVVPLLIAQGLRPPAPDRTITRTAAQANEK